MNIKRVFVRKQNWFSELICLIVVIEYEEFNLDVIKSLSLTRVNCSLFGVIGSVDRSPSMSRITISDNNIRTYNNKKSSSNLVVFLYLCEPSRIYL